MSEALPDQCDTDPCEHSPQEDDTEILRKPGSDSHKANEETNYDEKHTHDH